METPTLIIRIAGLYLAYMSIIALVQIHQVHAMSVPVSSPQASLIDNIGAQSILTLLIGLAAIVFAGRLARLLTFDAPRH
ncbi:MAG TPA: hypothetical protein VHD32_17310 [Candidatus Didemnitutus sp.]|nr:hypothetical protein [Candidatus Didemnitutus sp.]